MNIHRSMRMRRACLCRLDRVEAFLHYSHELVARRRARFGAQIDHSRNTAEELPRVCPCVRHLTGFGSDTREGGYTYGDLQRAVTFCNSSAVSARGCFALFLLVRGFLSSLTLFPKVFLRANRGYFLEPTLLLGRIVSENQSRRTHDLSALSV